MSNNQDKNTAYASGQGREFLRGELEDKPNHWIREFAGLVDDPQALDLLNYYASLWADRGKDFLDTRLAETIIRSCATKSIDEAFREGNVSQLQGMVGLTNRGADGADVLSDAAERLENEGAIGLMLGPPGAGKTALTLDIARTWKARTGGTLIGNTSWQGFDKVVNSDRELLEAMGHTKGPVLAIIDETAQELSGFGSDNVKAEEFSNSLTFVRKFEEKHGPHPKRGSVLMVNHTRTKTAKAFRDLCTFAVEKPSRNDPGRARLLDSDGGKDKFEELKEYKGITDTAETYSEHEASEFIIHGADDADDEEEQVDEEQVRYEERVRSYLIDCKPWDPDAGMSQKDAADKQGFGSTWSTDRKQEWEDGKWSHLEDVPDPAEVGTA